MTSSPPNVVPAHPDDEDRVVFKSSPATSPPNGTTVHKTSPTAIGAKRASLGVLVPSQPPFSPSPLILGPADAPAIGGDKTWDLADKLMQMQLRESEDAAEASRKGQEVVFPNVNDVGTSPDGLAPAAELVDKPEQQPHSRQSSNSTSSADSPTVPTPGHAKSSLDPKAGKSPYAAQGPETGYDDYGYGAYGQTLGINPSVQPNGVSAATSQLLNKIQHPVGAHFSPITGTFPRLMQNGMNPQTPPAQFTPGLPQSFGFQSPPGQANELNYANGTNLTNGGTAQNGVANPASYGAVTGQRAASNAQNFPYNSPPNAYAAGMMSPTLASPTFLSTGLNPYAASVMPPPNPYGAYAGTAVGGVGYDIPQGTPGSPLLNPQYPGRQPGFGGSQFRGRGQVPLGPAAMRGVAAVRGGRAPRGRGAGPTGTQSMAAAAATMNPATYAPYGGMSYDYAQGGQLQHPIMGPQATNPNELANLMAQMAAVGYQQGMMAAPYAAAAAAAPAVPNPGSRPDWMDVATWEVVQTQTGPSANNRKLGLYKTELCRSFEEKGECRYGDKCQFAHGEAEQRRVDRHPKYKTEICRTFWVSGSCPYGKRCCFIHTELPANTAASGGGVQGDGSNANNVGDRNHSAGARDRSMSTNSDPNDNQSSLLARIAAKGQANNAAAAAAARSTEPSPANGAPSAANIDAAVARAIAKFGPPDASVRKVETSPPVVEVAPVTPKAPAVFSNFPVGNSLSGSGSGVGLGIGGGGHHRMSASVDFGRVSRNLGSDLAPGFGTGGGHARNPSASSVVPNSLLSRSPNPPLSGHSTPYGNASTPNSGITSNGIHGSTLLDRTWA